MSEWFKELVLKTSDPARDRGFESHLLRWNAEQSVGFYFKVSVAAGIEVSFVSLEKYPRG